MIEVRQLSRFPGRPHARGGEPQVDRGGVLGYDAVPTPVGVNLTI